MQDSVLPRRLRRASIAIHSKLEPAVKCSNVVAMVPGTAVPDSFIVFTAHYDHLGKMGWDATFPGASDNASGTACVEWLAAHFAQQPQRYSMLFIAFSGEEAGLKGSHYFVEHSPVPLEKMRFLVNLDIMGSAENGVTVVNATGHHAEFSLLQSLNQEGGYLPEVRSRGKAANSDHYFFSEAGVPAFFLYNNGGPGYYHDVFDRPGTLPLTNVDKVLKLLMDFVAAIQ
jgi:Zn-dependent M28 family amino/carboxypeptidase